MYLVVAKPGVIFKVNLDHSYLSIKLTYTSYDALIES